MAIEKGRPNKRPLQIPSIRDCETCNILEYDLHFLINCEQFQIPSGIFFQKLQTIFIVLKHYSDVEKFKIIMKSQDYEVIVSFSKCMKNCIQIIGKT